MRQILPLPGIIQSFSVAEMQALHPQLIRRLEILCGIVAHIHQCLRRQHPPLLQNPERDIIRFPELRTAELVRDHNVLHLIHEAERL